MKLTNAELRKEIEELMSFHPNLDIENIIRGKGNPYLLTYKEGQLKARQEALEEVKKIIEIWWDACISSMHETSPKDKKLLATSGEIEKALDELLKSYKEDQIKEIKELEE